MHSEMMNTKPNHLRSEDFNQGEGNILLYCLFHRLAWYGSVHGYISC